MARQETRMIIWDYDGVIMDSFSCVHAVYLRIGAELGFPIPQDPEEFREAYGYSSREYLPRIGCTGDTLKAWDERYAELIIKEQPALFGGIKELLAWSKERTPQALLSASPRSEVEGKLRKHDLLRFFEEVTAGEDGKGPLSKTLAIPALLERRPNRRGHRLYRRPHNRL